MQKARPILRPRTPRRPRPRRGRPATSALALTGVALLALTGCGGSVEVSTGKETINLDQVEATIIKQYAAQEIELSRLDCDDDVELKVGAPIRCSAVNGQGTILNIRGSVTSTQGEGGRFRVRTVSAAVNGTVVADRARALLEKRVGEKARSLTCPPTIPIPTKPSVTCELTTMGGLELDTEITLNADAYLNVEVARTPKNPSDD